MKIRQSTLEALIAYLSEDKGAVAGLLLGQDLLSQDKIDVVKDEPDGEDVHK